MRLIDLANHRFGRLLILGLAPKSGRATRWSCLCDCGKTVVVFATHLVRGNTRSCGCGYRNDAEDFWRHTAPGSRGCIQWIGAKLPKGYGKIKYGGATQLAHRLAWELKRGPVPPGLELDHLCRNRACVNPDHLEPVTRTTNLRRGAGAKLSEGQVALIRKRIQGGEKLAPIAREFGVSPRTISDLNTQRTWKVEESHGEH